MDNGKSDPKVFASSHLDWNNQVEEKDWPATRMDVMTYVQNAFKTWHEPDHLMLLRLASVIDTLLLFLGERGIEVRDNKVTLSVEEIATWAELKKAQQQAAQAAVNPPDA
jgi:hypothetical protein